MPKTLVTGVACLVGLTGAHVQQVAEVEHKSDSNMAPDPIELEICSMK